ncbi:MAG: serine/threonine protein kinase [Verrucomicrobiales bacterium]|nr:serine/threonine protein kinase [Verrucomicrobiales bacterium]
MSSSPQRDLEVFTEAIALPVEHRPAFLDRACAGDGALRIRVEALLATHGRAGDFLEQPPEEIARGRPGATVSEGPGDRIGRYKLLQQIGEGGCGVVYLAEQEEPVRRRVALKIIKPGMDTRSVIARFEAERQALALMDHPNIAKVFDAGATESGRPYFVMELVRGIKITDYCDQESLTTEQRLALFVEVCQAVQHAHQKGIIHRDIKPSNLLVTTTLEGAPLPVVIDFGIAKATTSVRLTDKTFFTAFEMLVGTPDYMSPEQAEFASTDVDTRTDIYSLGVLLYELLTGSTPFDSRRLLEAGLDEIRRVIRDQEPVRPSMRLLRMTGEALTTVARRRRAEAPRLIRSVAGDLDWIVMKSLEKDRTRRYETANGLAQDVKRFLAHETINARPPSRFYRFKKLIRRNRLLFVGLALLTFLLVAGLITVSAALGREQQARHMADVALRSAKADQIKAETEATRSRQVTQFLEEMLQGVGPSVARGEDTRMLRGILDRTAESIGEKLSDQADVEAQLRGLIGRLYLEIGQWDQASTMHAAQVALYRKSEPRRESELAAALFDLATAHWKQRKLNDAEQALVESLEIRRRIFGPEHAAVAATLNNLGAVYRRQRRLEEAEKLTRDGLGIRTRLFGDESLEVAESLRNLAIVLVDRGLRPEGETAARRMLEIRRRLLGQDHPLVAASLADLAWVLGSGTNPEEIESLETEAFGIQRRWLGDLHPDVARSAYLLGERMRVRGNLVEAHAVLEAVASIQRRLLGEGHPDVLATLRGLALTLESEGQWAEAEKVHREALEHWRKRSSIDDPHHRNEVESLANVLARQHRLDEALALLDSVLTPSFVEQPQCVGLLGQRIELRGRLSRFSEATQDALLAVKYRPDDDWRHQILAALQAITGDTAGYAGSCQKYFARFSTTQDPYVADRLTKVCLLRPSVSMDLAALNRLTDLAMAGVGNEDHAMPYFQLGKATALLRLGNDAAALELATQVLNSARTFTHGQACAVAAMASWRLGDQDTARALLARGQAIAPPSLPQREREDPDRAWFAWIFSKITLEEAAALVTSKGEPAAGPN